MILNKVCLTTATYSYSYTILGLQSTNSQLNVRTIQHLSKEMSDYIEVHTERNTFRLSGRPCEISSYAFVPKNRNDPPERTYFNTPQTQGQNIDERIKRPGSATYDRLFKYPEGYNNKLHRDDREHAKSQGLHVNHEEKDKAVPSLSSTEYGHRLNHHLEKRDRKHVRIGHVQSEFYRRNMIP